MIGLLIVTHGHLGSELLKTAEFILGSIEACSTISIDGHLSPESIRAEIEKGISKVDCGKGVLILTDMFGGTPSNISLSFLNPNRVEVLTGANLPMLIKAVQLRSQMDLNEMARQTGDYSRKSITVAGEILGRRPGKE